MVGGATFNVRLQGQHDGSIDLCQQAEGGPQAGLKTVGSVSLRGVVESANRNQRAKGVITSTIASFEGIDREQKSKSAKIMAVPVVSGPPPKRARIAGGIGRKAFPSSTRGLGLKTAAARKPDRKPDLRRSSISISAAAAVAAAAAARVGTAPTVVRRASLPSSGRAGTKSSSAKQKATATGAKAKAGAAPAPLLTAAAASTSASASAPASASASTPPETDGSSLDFYWAGPRRSSEANGHGKRKRRHAPAGAVAIVATVATVAVPAGTRAPSTARSDTVDGQNVTQEAVSPSPRPSMAETVPDTAGALPRQHQQVAAAPDDGAVVAVAGAPDASAVTYTHIKGTMASIAAGLQLLHVRQLRHAFC